jgi:hypothetical protein
MPFPCVEGLSVSRAYNSPEKPSPCANFLFLLGFLTFFWKGGNGTVEQNPTYGVYSWYKLY